MQRDERIICGSDYELFSVQGASRKVCCTNIRDKMSFVPALPKGLSVVGNCIQGSTLDDVFAEPREVYSYNHYGTILIEGEFSRNG